MTTALANQTSGLTNGRAANWVPEVEFSLFRALSRCQITYRISKFAASFGAMLIPYFGLKL